MCSREGDSEKKDKGADGRAAASSYKVHRHYHIQSASALKSGRNTCACVCTSKRLKSCGDAVICHNAALL